MEAGGPKGKFTDLLSTGWASDRKMTWQMATVKAVNNRVKVAKLGILEEIQSQRGGL